MSIIKELYHGNIRPDTAKTYGEDSDYMRLVKIRQEKQEKLMELLDDEGKELFAEHGEVAGEARDIMQFDAFDYGVRFTVMLMTEAFIGRPYITREEVAKKAAELFGWE